LQVVILRKDKEIEYRILGKAGGKVSSVSFGAWGQVDDDESMKALLRAVELFVIAPFSSECYTLY
jgi:hypothetical protein